MVTLDKVCLSMYSVDMNKGSEAKTLVNLYIDKEQRAWLVDHSKKTSLSMSVFIRRALDKYIKEYKGEGEGN